MTRNLLYLNNPASYMCADISQSCIQALELGLRRTNPRQRHGGQSLTHLFQEDERLEYNAWPTCAILNAYKDAFCDCFFSGALKSFVEVGIEISNSRSLYGTTQSHPEHGVPYALIKIINPHSRGRCLSEMRAAVLQTLLHELVHALFEVYQCRGELCNEHFMILNTRGFTGHGPSWVYLAAKLRETVLQWPFLAEVLQPRATPVPLRIITRTDIESELRSAQEHGFCGHSYPDSFLWGLVP